MATAKRIRLENLTRDVIHLQVGAKADDVVVLGDKADGEAKGGDPKLQPSPVVQVDPAEWQRWDTSARAVVEDLIRQGRIRRTVAEIGA